MRFRRLIASALTLTVMACEQSSDVPEGMSSTPPPQPAPATTPTMIARATQAAPDPPTSKPATSAPPATTTSAPTAADSVGPAPTPDLQGFPIAAAPGGLGSLVLPDTFADVTAVFARLPPAVGGHTRTPEFDRVAPGRSGVGYGADQRPVFAGNPLLSIQAIDIAQGDFFPTNWTGGQVVAEMARQGEAVKDAGRDGDLVWMRRETFMDTGQSRVPIFTMLWGRLDSPWMFTVQAGTPEDRDVLLAALVKAATPAAPSVDGAP